MKVKKRKKEVLMPKNRKEETIYAMVCYNIAMDVGGMKNFVFLASLSELPIMCIAAFLLDTFIAGPIAKKVAFRLVNPKEDKPIFVILAISVLSIWLMCPMMSFVAVVLFKNAFGPQLIAVWIQTTIINFPMAFFWQLFAAGPLVRTIFGKIFK